MKKQKLIIDYEYDFELWGIVSSIKEYKLAWQINNAFPLELMREADIKVSSEKMSLSIVNYKSSSENSVIRLLKNKSIAEKAIFYLVPELKKIDYFFIIDSDDDTFPIENLYHCLNKCSGVEYLTKIDLSKLNSKDNLLF
ncbi:MAG: IPExxxVDY family protein [Bacteroidota bacterium]